MVWVSLRLPCRVLATERPVADRPFCLRKQLPRSSTPGNWSNIDDDDDDDEKCFSLSLSLRRGIRGWIRSNRVEFGNFFIALYGEIRVLRKTYSFLFYIPPWI